MSKKNRTDRLMSRKNKRTNFRPYLPKITATQKPNPAKKYTQVESELMNAIRKWIDNLKGKSKLTRAWFYTIETDRTHYYREFYRGGMLKGHWQVFDIMLDKVRIAITTESPTEWGHSDCAIIIVDILKGEFSINNVDEYSNEIFLQSISDTLPYLHEIFKKHAHEKRGKILSNKLGI